MIIFKKQKGAVTVMAAVMLPVVLAFTGIAVDIGRLYVEKAKLQNLADAAATAALVQMKKPETYKNSGLLAVDSVRGCLTTTIPIGALSDNSETVEAIRDAVNAAAYDYLAKNYHLGTFEDNKSKVETEFYTLKNSNPAANTDDVVSHNNTYYYEVILSKRFPVYFARIIHPKDVLVRAGAVCMLDIQEQTDKMKYAAALQEWGKKSWNELRQIPESARLDMDILALTLIAKNILGKDKAFLETELGYTANSVGGNGNLLGHYWEGTSKSPYTYTTADLDSPDAVNSFFKANTKAGDKIMSWLQGNYSSDQAFNGEGSRYLFSDYAIGLKSDGKTRTGENLKDGIKIKYNTAIDPSTNKRIVTEVTILINPGDINNGSAPLSVTGKLVPSNNAITWN